MVHKTLTRTLLVSAVVLTGWTVAPTVAGASGQVQLHELLFNRAKRQQRRQEFRGETPRQEAITPQRQTTQRPRQVRRVSGPQYYTYAAPTLTTVTLATLLTDAQTTGAITAGSITGETGDLPPMVVLDDDRFAQAIAHAPQTQIDIEPGIADAIRDYYADNPAFLWVDGMDVSAEGRALTSLLTEASEHGLDPAHYAVALPDNGWSMDDPGARYSQLLAFELALTARAIRYAMDVKDGAVNPNKLSGYHDFGGDRLSPEMAMAALAQSDGAVSWLNQQAPRQPEYAKLQVELATLRTSTDDSIVLPDDIMMRPGAIDEALPMVMAAIDRKISDETRAEHASTLNAYAGTTLYDGAIVDLVKAVQDDLGLVDDGVVGPKTAAGLDGESLATKINRVELALERLRWHPEDYADRHVVINSPEYRVRYLENGEPQLSMRAVVGKKSNQTYFFHDQIDHVVYDPYWGVPQSIIVNSYLPKLWRDPSYLDRNGFVVTTGSGQRVSSSAINWSQYNGKVPFNVRQKPGPSNALGELKIMFPNRHAIYMHDTPAKNLFARDSRAYSHGCVRLEDPRAMAAAVLGKSVDHVRAQLGGYEQVEKLDAKVPVYVGYFTAWPNDDGVIDYHPDVYERDKYLGRALETIDTARTG